MIPRCFFGTLNGAQVARISMPGVDVRTAHEGQLLLSERGIPLVISSAGIVTGTSSSPNSGSANYPESFSVLPLVCAGILSGNTVSMLPANIYIAFSTDNYTPITVFTNRITYPTRSTVIYSVFRGD